MDTSPYLPRPEPSKRPERTEAPYLEAGRFGLGPDCDNVKHRRSRVITPSEGYLVTVNGLEIARSLPLSTRAPRSARGLLDSLGPLVPGPILDRVRLVVSELVTNAVKHSGLAEGAPIDVRILAGTEKVRIEVMDDGRGFTTGERHRASLRSGWGLHLVEGVSDRWGVQVNDHTYAWAEFDLAS
jgi:anti-sigma regulatory factor (Ser/Thr protein kinase)